MNSFPEILCWLSLLWHPCRNLAPPLVPTILWLCPPTTLCQTVRLPWDQKDRGPLGYATHSSLCRMLASVRQKPTFAPSFSYNFILAFELLWTKVERELVWKALLLVIVSRRLWQQTVLANWMQSWTSVDLLAESWISLTFLQGGNSWIVFSQG